MLLLPVKNVQVAVEASRREHGVGEEEKTREGQRWRVDGLRVREEERANLLGHGVTLEVEEVHVAVAIWG